MTTALTPIPPPPPTADSYARALWQAVMELQDRNRELEDKVKRLEERNGLA